MIRRQMFDLPTITVRVVEHRLVSRRCACGTVTQAAAPAGVAAPVSYGPSAATIAVYLVLGQHLPVARTAGLLAEVFGTPMATGTVAAWTARAAAGLAPFTTAARAALTRAELVHADETGLRVAGRLHWLHVACSSRFTALFCHHRRGKEAIDAAGVLPGFIGTPHFRTARQFRHSAEVVGACGEGLSDLGQEVGGQDGQGPIDQEAGRRPEPPGLRGRTSLRCRRPGMPFRGSW